MMIILTTQQRAIVNHDGASATVRPLTGAEAIMARDEAEKGSGALSVFLARTATVKLDGVTIDARAATPNDVDYLPKEFISKIAAKVSELTFPTSADSKNSTLPRHSSPEPRATSESGASGNSEANVG